MPITYSASGLDQIQEGISNEQLNSAGTYYTTQSVYQKGCVLVGTSAWQLIDTGSIGDTRVLVATNLNTSASVIILASDSGGTKPITYLYSNGFPSRVNWSGSLQPYAKAVISASYLQYELIPS